MKNSTLFFDDICKTCIFSVKFLIRIDTSRKLRYSALNSKTYNTTISVLDQVTLPDSIILFHQGIILTKSDAILKVFSILGGYWNIFLVFRFFPKFLRDKMYDIVAKYRYNLIGRKKACYIPLNHEKELFLP